MVDISVYVTSDIIYVKSITKLFEELLIFDSNSNGIRKVCISEILFTTVYSTQIATMENDLGYTHHKIIVRKLFDNYFNDGICINISVEDFNNVDCILMLLRKAFNYYSPIPMVDDDKYYYHSPFGENPWYPTIFWDIINKTPTICTSDIVDHQRFYNKKILIKLINEFNF